MYVLFSQANNWSFTKLIVFDGFVEIEYKLEIQDKIIIYKRLGRIEVSDDTLVFFVWRHVIVFTCFIILPFHIVLHSC
jgi:hypothetical protein